MKNEQIQQIAIAEMELDIPTLLLLRNKLKKTKINCVIGASVHPNHIKDFNRRCIEQLKDYYKKVLENDKVEGEI